MLKPGQVVLLPLFISLVDVVFSNLRHTHMHTRARPNLLFGVRRGKRKSTCAASWSSASQRYWCLNRRSLTRSSSGQGDERYHQHAASRWGKSTASAQSHHHGGAYAGSHAFCGGEQSQRNTCWISKRTHTRARAHTMEMFFFCFFYVRHNKA